MGGRTLLEHSLAVLSGVVDEIVVAAPATGVHKARLMLPGATVIEGGADRQTTVRAMLAQTGADVVLVHDVARPS